MTRVIPTLIVILLVGCGESRSTKQTRRDLMDIGMEYHMFHSEYDRPPSSMEEFLSFEDPHSAPGNRSAQATCQAALRSDKYVVIWGSRLDNNRGNTWDQTILAYEKNVPEKGGFVCFKSGSVRTVTKEEFAKAPKTDEKQINK